MPARKTLLWVTLLYLAQGLPYGITSRVWPVYFRSHGVSLAEIGLLGLISLPWSWKPLWAPLVDRFGTRRAWIVPCLVALAALVAVFGELPPVVGPLLVATMLAFTFASATQDIAMDAWVVDAATGRDLGPINGLRAAAFRVAMIAAGGVALLLADRFGWRAAWLALGGSLLALAAASLLLPEPRRTHAEGNSRSTRELVRSFAAWLLRPAMIPVVLFALLYKLGDQAMARMVEPFWVDSGRSLTEIALVANSVGLALTVAGALAGGAFIARAGLFTGLLWLGLAQAATNLGYAAVAAVELPPQALWFAAAGENFAQGLGTAALLAFLTSACRPENAATEYALLSALFAFSREIAGALSGFGAERMGYAGFFAFTALLAVPGLAMLPWLRRSATWREIAALEARR